jgi:hypothetical protein
VALILEGTFQQIHEKQDELGEREATLTREISAGFSVTGNKIGIMNQCLNSTESFAEVFRRGQGQGRLFFLRFFYDQTLNLMMLRTDSLTESIC